MTDQVKAWNNNITLTIKKKKQCIIQKYDPFLINANVSILSPKCNVLQNDPKKQIVHLPILSWSQWCHDQVFMMKFYFCKKHTNAQCNVPNRFYSITLLHTKSYFSGLAHFIVPSSKGVVASKKSWGHEGSVTTSMRWLVTEVIANIFSS